MKMMKHNKNKIYRTVLSLLVIVFAFVFAGCSVNQPNSTDNAPHTAQPSQTASVTNTVIPTSPSYSDTQPTPNDTNSSSSTPTETPDEPITPTPKTTMMYTIDPTFNPGTEFPPIVNHDVNYCYGPYYFGDELYYVYADGYSMAVFDPLTEIDLISVDAVIPENREMFFTSASLIDLNFDGYSDFSYLISEDGKRECFLSVLGEDGKTVTYERNETFSSLYNLSRCYETRSIYGKVNSEDDFYCVWQESDGQFTKLEETVPDIFEWNAEKIATALFGEGTSVKKSDDVTVRGCTCKSVSVFGTLTIAYDKYGQYYIKDMPTSGFCRLSLNPDGRWSKSEKVGS